MGAGELARASKASCFKQVVSIQRKNRSGRARACCEPQNFSDTPRRGNRYTIHCPGNHQDSEQKEEVKQHEYDDARKKRLRRAA